MSDDNEDFMDDDENFLDENEENMNGEMDEANEVAPRNGRGTYKSYDMDTHVRQVDAMNDGQDLGPVAKILKMNSHSANRIWPEYCKNGTIDMGIRTGYRKNCLDEDCTLTL